MFPEDSDMSTEGLQKGGDIDLLQGFFTVVNGHQDIQRADTVGLLQTAEHACTETKGLMMCGTQHSFYLSLKTQNGYLL